MNLNNLILEKDRQLHFSQGRKQVRSRAIIQGSHPYPAMRIGVMILAKCIAYKLKDTASLVLYVHKCPYNRKLVNKEPSV